MSISRYIVVAVEVLTKLLVIEQRALRSRAGRSSAVRLPSPVMPTGEQPRVPDTPRSTLDDAAWQ
jgi:hypothetical protein